MMSKKLNFLNKESVLKCFALFPSMDFGRTFKARTPMKKSIVAEVKSWKNPRSIIVFQIHLFLEREIILSTDPIIRILQFYQTAREVLTGYYPCNRTQAVWLAALMAQYRFGDFNNKIHTTGFYVSGLLPNFLPVALIAGRAGERKGYKKRRLASLEKAIFTAHKKMIGMSRDMAMNQYIDNCCKLPFYACAMFRVSLDDASKSLLNINDSAIYVGVSVVGLKLFALRKKKYLRIFQFNSLITWGFTETGDFFVSATLEQKAPSISTNGTRDSHRVVMKTKQGKCLADLLGAYAEALVVQKHHERKSSRSKGQVDGDDELQMSSKYTKTFAGSSTTRGVGDLKKLNKVMVVVRLQGIFRGWKFRKLVKKTAAVIKIQKMWRGYVARRRVHWLAEKMLAFARSKRLLDEDVKSSNVDLGS